MAGLRENPPIAGHEKLASVTQEITPEDLFGPLGVRKRIRLAVYAAALGAGVIAVTIPIARRLSQQEITAENITANCSIRYVPETDAYRGICDLTAAEGLKPRLQFYKPGPEAELIVAYEAEMNFSRHGTICTSKRRFPVLPKTTTKLPGEKFTCAVRPPK